MGCKAERAHKSQLHVDIETCILIRKHTDKNEVKKLIFKIPKDKISLYINIFIKKNLKSLRQREMHLKSCVVLPKLSF